MIDARLRRACACAVFSLTIYGLSAPAAGAQEVNIYSYRQPFLIEPLLDAFTDKTGIETNVVFADAGLAQRIAAEGANSPADILFTVDIGRLTEAVNLEVSQPVESETLAESIPEQYRDPDGHWFGLTMRARVVYASKERVEQDSITYEELAEPEWKGRVCLRSGQHPYNVALIASMIANHGEAKTEEWLKGLKENLAQRPAGSDREQVKSIYAGVCDVAIANTYYMAAMMNNERQPEQKAWAASVRILFPNTDERGTHVNVSGMVLAKHAPNRDDAVKLMEFLASEEGQSLYAEINNEYPVNLEVEAGELARSWGEFEADPVPLATVGELRKTASELIDKVHFDDGPGA